MDRGQLYTMEAVIGGLLMFIALLFVIQGLGVTPQSFGDASEQSVNEQRSLVEGGLQSVNDSTIQRALLYWDTRGETFHCNPTGRSFYPGYANATCANASKSYLLNGSKNLTSQVPPTEFGAALREQFGSGYSYNIYVTYNDSGTLERQRMVYQGQPGSGAARATRSVMLYNDSVLLNKTGHPRTGAVRNMSQVEQSDFDEFYAPDSQRGSDIWNIFQVEVVVWQG